MGGAEDACGRQWESASLERAEGSGPPKAAWADAKVEEARELTIGALGGMLRRARPSQLDNPKITCGAAPKEIGSETTARRRFKEELDCKPSRQMQARRMKPVAAHKRLGCRRAWRAQIESGELDPRGIYWAGEQLFR